MADKRLNVDLSEYDAIEKVLPRTGWLGKYIELTNGLNACPRFRFFSALAIMGAAINNKMSLQRGTTGTVFPKFFPNPWILLLAPPGRGSKTSTINMACNLLLRACPQVRLLADQTTPEALCEALSTPNTPANMIHIGPVDATGIIRAPEFSVFFGKQQYNMGMVSLITTLYDYHERWSSRTIKRGAIILRNTCITVYGGSTPQWLQAMLPQDSFTGGFMARFIIVEMPHTYFKRVAIPKEPSKDDWNELIKQLADIGNLREEFKLSKNGWNTYTNIYESYRPTGDPQCDSYKERESEQILRIAMLLSLSDNASEVGNRHLKKAQDILNIIEAETAVRIERLSCHPRMAIVQEIKEVLAAFGTLHEKELLRKIYRSLSLGESQYYEALRILKDTDQLRVSGKPGEAILSLKIRRNV